MLHHRPATWGGPCAIAFCLAAAIPVRADIPAAVVPEATYLLAGGTLPFAVIWAPGGTRARSTTAIAARTPAVESKTARAGSCWVDAATESKSSATVAEAPKAGITDRYLAWTLRDENGALISGTSAGSIDVKGVYTAPAAIADPLIVKVRAAHWARPGAFVEATVLVLPQAPFATIEKFLGRDWLEPFSAVHPFRSQEEGGRRFHYRDDVQNWSAAAPAKPPMLLAGLGQPVDLRWEPQAGPQLLSYLENGQPVYHNVTGLDSLAVTFRGRVQRVTVESLQKVMGPEGPWASTLQEFQVRVRGLLPVAGRESKDEGFRAGAGDQAHFRGLGGLVRVPGDTDGDPDRFLAADTPSHTVVRHGGAHGVELLAGRPDQPGHLDGKWAEALFNQPTYLSVYSQVEDDRNLWGCAVADSGNHAIRLISHDGTVTTLAGNTGHPGNRNSRNPLQAQFRDPRGLAWDEEGNLYVADQGNRVIRRISISGLVETFAGKVEQAGIEDGIGTEARFTDLRGLCYARQGDLPMLYVLDGHAIRRISLTTREVVTVAGQVNEPGYLDVSLAEPKARREAVRKPCLNDPWGIENAGPFLLVTDRRNHAVRAFWHESGNLQTLAGDPQSAGRRWGLLRDTLTGPATEAYGSFAGPTGVAWDEARRSALVADGSTLTALDSLWEEGMEVLAARLRCPKTVPPGPIKVKAAARGGEDKGDGTRPVRFTVDFIESDGTLASRAEATGRKGAAVEVEGTFSRPGKAQVILRVLTDQGVSAGDLAIVQVQ